MYYTAISSLRTHNVTRPPHAGRIKNYQLSVVCVYVHKTHMKFHENSSFQPVTGEWYWNETHTLASTVTVQAFLFYLKDRNRLHKNSCKMKRYDILCFLYAVIKINTKCKSRKKSKKLLPLTLVTTDRLPSAKYIQFRYMIKQCIFNEGSFI
jgi:hypothetical protein